MQQRIAFIVIFGFLPALTALPVLAEGCHDEVKMPCTQGAVWDELRQICAPKPSS